MPKLLHYTCSIIHAEPRKLVASNLTGNSPIVMPQTNGAGRRICSPGANGASGTRGTSAAVQLSQLCARNMIEPERWGERLSCKRSCMRSLSAGGTVWHSRSATWRDQSLPAGIKGDGPIRYPADPVSTCTPRLTAQNTLLLKPAAFVAWHMEEPSQRSSSYCSKGKRPRRGEDGRGKQEAVV